MKSRRDKVVIDCESVASDIISNCITEIAKCIIGKLNESPKNAAKSGVFASVVDAMRIECDWVKNYYPGHIDGSRKIGSILLLAVRLNSNKKIYAKGYTTIFISSNMKQQVFVGEYLSNSITCIKKNEVIETHIFVDPKDDFFTESTIDDSNRVFIIPLIFSDLSNSNIQNFSDAQLVIVDQANDIHRIQVDLTGSICNRKYIEQRVRIITDN